VDLVARAPRSIVDSGAYRRSNVCSLLVAMRMVCEFLWAAVGDEVSWSAAFAAITNEIRITCPAQTIVAFRDLKNRGL
jgi:hypothetical protein